MHFRVAASDKRFIPRSICVRWTLLFSFAMPGTSVWAQTAAPPGAPPGEPSIEPSIEPGEPPDKPDEPLGEPFGAPSEPPGTSPDTAEPSPEELAELEAALGEDARDAAESRPAPSTPGALGSALASLNPDITIIADISLAYFSEPDHLQTGAHDPTQTGFNLQALEISLGKAVDPYFRLDGTLVFTDEEAELEEAYATTLALPWNLQARLGKFLTRIGRINPTHPHRWDFVDQPFVLGRLFGAEGNRGLGFELSYLTPLPWYTDLIVSVTDARGDESARSFLGADEATPDSPLDFQMSFMLEQFFELHPDWSLLWGISVATGPNASADGSRTDIYATDLYLKYRPITRGSYTIVSLQTEWFHRRRQIVDDRLRDISGYAQLFWRFHKRWAAAARYEYGSPARTRDNAVGADDLDPAWTDNRHRATANTTFWPTEFSRIRLQGSIDMPTWQDQPIHALMLSFEFITGAHGAHTF